MPDWNFTNIQNVSYMFYDANMSDISNCQGLNDMLNNSNKLNNMQGMFKNVKSLGCILGESLNFGDWKTDKVTDMSDMFNNCKIDTIFDGSCENLLGDVRFRSNYWNTGNVKNM